MHQASFNHYSAHKARQPHNKSQSTYCCIIDVHYVFLLINCTYVLLYGSHTA